MGRAYSKNGAGSVPRRRGRAAAQFAAALGTHQGQGRRESESSSERLLPDRFVGGPAQGNLIRLRGLSPAGNNKFIIAIKALRHATKLDLKECKEILDRVRSWYPENNPSEYLTIRSAYPEAVEDLKAQGWIAEPASTPGAVVVTVQVPLEHRQALAVFLREHGGSLQT